MIRVDREVTFPLAEAPNRIPAKRDGRRCSFSTVYRWATAGIRGVRLETVRVGGALFTSAEALQRFYDRLAALDVAGGETDSSEPSVTPGRAE